MKKLLFLFSLLALIVPAAFSQDDTYYTDDQATVVTKAPEAPPALPDYTQPPCPADGYFWQPGYWAWGVDGYYWVPGVWILPPHPGYLWTPGYWGFYGGFYGWHNGYWGLHIGYYGGINYGFGYYGNGFYGGRWEGGVFRYNTAVWHVGVNIHNTYVSREGIHEVVNHASFNGPNGVHYRPAGAELTAMHENHIAPTRAQVQHHSAAIADHVQSYHANNGTPAYHSMSKPGGQRFDAHGGAYHAPAGGHAGGGGHGGGRR
jgi:hypothetical protein